MIPRRAVAYPADVNLRLVGVFHGRPSINVTTMRAMMGGLPGLCGDDVERDIVGSVRDGVVDRGYGWRLPAVAAKAGIALAGSGRAAATVLATTGRWWSERFGRHGIKDGTPPRTALDEARHHFTNALVAQGRNRMLYQAASSRLIALAERSGHPELAATLLSGAGGLEEAAVAEDLRRLAEGALPLEAFLARHGFHGPNAGDITSRSWREDPAPVERLAKTLRRSGAAGPRRDGTDMAAAVDTVVAGLPRVHRAVARAALRSTPATARNLERSKIAMAMSLDGARAAARALGAEMVTGGHLESAEDVFFLFIEELMDGEPRDLRPLVGERRRNHEFHQRVDLATASWKGNPEIRELAHREASTTSVVTGIGASPGVVEGTVRVVLDAGANTDVEHDEILVCPVTDPSWVSLMTVAGALVIDIGGIASHGAIVARELGVPCVIGTATGTVNLCTGDRVRVDGGTGVVTVLARADDR